MAEQDPGLGGRLPLLDPASLTPHQKTLYDALQHSWVKFADSIGVEAETDDGKLIGPFNFLLLHPEVSEKLSDFQVAEQKHTILADRTREVVILTIGGIWKADYELYAQRGSAEKLGFSSETVAAIAAGELPDDLSVEEKLAGRLARTLALEHRVDDALYAEAERTFGARGLYDILAVMGVYQVVCSGMALFEVPAPR